MNRNRVWIAGIAAGVFWIVVDFVGHGMILMSAYAALGEQGIIHSEPQIPFLPLLMLADLAIGIGLAWLYAAARPRLGPGPRTALLIGLVAFLLLIPANLSQIAWTKVTADIQLGSVIIAAVQAFGGAQIAGWLYKE